MKSCDKKITIGLTGSFGSGKTTVARMFGDLGAKVIDADKISHSIFLKSRGSLYKKIVKTFGKGILNKDKTINRRQLSRIVFASKDSIENLNRIMHPEIIRCIKKELGALNKGVVVLDAALILETGQRGLLDYLIVVKTTIAKQIQRLKKKLGFKKEEILKRIRFQMPLKEKIGLADFIIDNNRTIKETKIKVKEIFTECCKAV